MRVILFLMHFRFGVLIRVELQKRPAANKNATGGSFHFLSFQVTAVFLCVCCSEITTETPSVILEKTEKSAGLSSKLPKPHFPDWVFTFVRAFVFILVLISNLMSVYMLCTIAVWGFIHSAAAFDLVSIKETTLETTLIPFIFFPSSAPCVIITLEMSQMLQHLILYDAMSHNISNLGPRLFFSPMQEMLSDRFVFELFFGIQFLSLVQ